MKTMKTTFAIILAGLLYSACTLDIENESMNISMKLRSQNEAISIAEKAYSAFNVEKSSRAGHAITATVSDVQVVKGRSSRGVANDTLLYVVNFEDEKGYAIVSPSLTTEPLLGIADEGTFDLSKANANPNFSYYLECASEYVSNSMSSAGIGIPSGPIGPSFPGTPGDSLVQNFNVLASKGPFVNYKWGQGSPYGDNYENGNCGCVPPVIAMIGLTLGWPDVSSQLREVRSHISNGEGCTEDASFVHPLIADFMERTECNNGTYDCIGENTIYTMNDGYNQFSLPDTGIYSLMSADTEDVNDVICHLDEFGINHDNALAYASTANNDGYNHNVIDHCWLIDGYKTVRMVRDTVPLTYLHCNWAWDGEGNGFFLPASHYQTALSYDKRGHHQHPQINSNVVYSNVIRIFPTGSNRR